MIKLTQYLFSRNEISRLSNLFSSPHLAGFDATYLQVPNLDEEKVASVLCARGVLEKNQNSQFSLNPSLTPLFETLFRPERVLLVVRDVPAAGTQQVVFLIRQNMIILHAQPEQESHSLSMISVDEMVGLIEEWFSEYRGDTALNAQLRIPFTEFEHVRKISEQGESEQAKNLLKAHTDANDETADNLITQMQTRKVSASFMFFEVNGEKAHDLETFAMFTGSSTQWVVTEDPANHDLIVFCSKESFNSEVQKIIGKFYKKKDSGLTSFILSPSMLAYSFQLLNQADLAYQLLEEEGVKEREAQKTFLEDGYRALRQAQLLVHSSPGKIPYLVNHFELALLPLMVFNSLIQVRMNFSDSFAKVMVHLNSQGTFTAHFKAGSDHIIENGPVYALANYIEKTFPNLNFSATRVDGLNTLIDHNLLMSLVAKDADRNTVATQLSKSGISRKITEKLTDDIMSHKMRGMLTHSLASSKATLDEVEKCKKNYFLLLQGESRCWVCTFYNFPDDKSGRLELVNRQRFIDRINEYVQSK